jgi:rhodanese-related sulfurtransferase
MREVKDFLYEQVSRVGKALASPKRLELIELLCQSEKSVESLATEADISMKLASAHLKALRAARLVDARKEGKRVFYRLADPSVAQLWVDLRSLAEERLLELQVALQRWMVVGDSLHAVDRRTILRQARAGEVVVLDVRPEQEFAASHLPFARSIPLEELKKRLKEVPKDKSVVAYCRGPFCMMARDAVTLLRKRGYRALRLEDGVAEWRARGLPLKTGNG